MARTKQTARKNTGGKPLTMAKGKDPAPQPKSKPGKSDQKVIIEYSSDEEEPQQGGAPTKKKVKKQVHLTLPVSPTHVMTTESFKTFFINHGLTKALRKAFEKRGWSTDQIQELRTNFKNKYGQTIPCPRFTRTKTPQKMKVCSWEMERELVGRPQVVVRKAEAKAVVRVEARAPLPEPHEMMVVLAVLVVLVALVGLAVLVALVGLVELVAQEGSEQANEVGMTTTTMMTPTNAERWGKVGRHPNSRQPVRSRASRVPPTLQSTEICPLSTSPVTRRGQS